MGWVMASALQVYYEDEGDHAFESIVQPLVEVSLSVLNLWKS